MILLSFGSHSRTYRSQAVGWMKFPGSTDEQSHVGQEKGAPGETWTGIAQLAPLKRFTKVLSP